MCTQDLLVSIGVNIVCKCARAYAPMCVCMCEYAYAYVNRFIETENNCVSIGVCSLHEYVCIIPVHVRTVLCATGNNNDTHVRRPEQRDIVVRRQHTAIVTAGAEVRTRSRHVTYALRRDARLSVKLNCVGAREK